MSELYVCKFACTCVSVQHICQCDFFFFYLSLSLSTSLHFLLRGSGESPHVERGYDKVSREKTWGGRVEEGKEEEEGGRRKREGGEAEKEEEEE